jgi:isopentenyldiphosphate isomerase
MRHTGEAGDTEEMVDVLHPSGESAGWSVYKSEAHRRGLYHRCFHCWIVSPGTGAAGPYLFVQRRAAQKENWPGRLDTTAAGHLSAGEAGLDGLREVEEELGISPEPDRLVPLGSRRVEQDIPLGTDRELHEVFLLIESLDPGDVRLQKEEVEALLKLRLADVEHLYGGGEIMAEEWTASGAVRQTSVTLDEFVPNDDRYPLMVARAAAACLAGEDPGEVFRVS